MQKQIPISSVVLSSQRIELKEALYNAVKQADEKQEAANRLVKSRQKLIPSVTPVFKREQNLYVYLPTYEHEASTLRPLIAFLSFSVDRGRCSKRHAWR